MVMTQELAAGKEDTYSTNQLAHGLRFLSEHPELVEQMEEVDGRVKPKDAGDRQWEEEIEAEQKATFKRLLDGLKNN